MLGFVGLKTLWGSHRDVHLLIFIRLMRMIAFGQSSLVLTLLFEALGVPEDRTGFFMTLTLVGDVVLSYFVTLYADLIGHKRVLVAGALLMAVSGIIFTFTDNFWWLLLAAVIGVISPSGNEVGPFRAVEESSLAHVSQLEERADIYAWYALLGGLGASVGSFSAGFIVDIWQSRYGGTLLEGYKMVYLSYSILGFFKALFSAFLSDNIEVHAAAESNERSALLSGANGSANSHGESVAAEGAAATQAVAKRSKFRLLPQLSGNSKSIVILLSLLFAVDAFGSSMASIAWITYYIHRKFEISTSMLGSIFFTTGLVSSISSLGGAIIARYLGPLLTMVVTHLPSSSILAFIPLPRTLQPTLVLLIIRSCTATMDVAPRQAFLSAVVRKEERTAVMGWVNVVKTAASAIGPMVTGWLTRHDAQWIAFVMAGVLKASYDLGILGTFLTVKLHTDG